MSDKKSVELTIDSNEEAQGVEAVETFVLHEDVEEFTIEPLETGDFIVEDCIFERKTPSDFASSLQEGRLREQVERMAASDYRPFVLVEGDMSDFSNLEHSQMPPKSLRGMTASIIGRNGIPVVFCSNPKLLADIAIRIARKTEEDLNNHHVKSTEAVKDVPFVTQFFMNVEGIGLSTAEELTEAFGSVEKALNASTDELASVGGIGEKRAQNIHDTIHEGEETTTERQTTSIRI
jgi:ERCC4-type nuclease